MTFFDAHCHRPNSDSGRFQRVVNGTRPADWQAVLQLAAKDSTALPAIGLHPWQVKQAPRDWQTHFLQVVENARAIGEIGLDRWIDAPHMKEQEAAFRWQLEQATERELPVSIHCLKASDLLLHLLKTQAVPRRGIHLHAYSGSAEQVAQFVELGAYFSFHAGQFSGQAKKAPAAAQTVPTDRLLVESDAPDALKHSENYGDFLRRGYQQIAELRGVSLEQLTETVAANFARYFLDD